jgi:hypothetical protein
MKKTIRMGALALLCTTLTYAQESTIEQDIKMYSQVWDDVINKGEIDQINATHFDDNVTGIASPENMIALKPLKPTTKISLPAFRIDPSKF